MEEVHVGSLQLYGRHVLGVDDKWTMGPSEHLSEDTLKIPGGYLSRLFPPHESKA